LGLCCGIKVWHFLAATESTSSCGICTYIYNSHVSLRVLTNETLPTHDELGMRRTSLDSPEQPVLSIPVRPAITTVLTHDSVIHKHDVVALQHVKRVANGLCRTATHLLLSLCNCLLVCTLPCYACYVSVCHSTVVIFSRQPPVTCRSVFLVVFFCWVCYIACQNVDAGASSAN